jgi:glycosyltransferase involved in cell wall biosynthesis
VDKNACYFQIYFESAGNCKRLLTLKRKTLCIMEHFKGFLANFCQYAAMKNEKHLLILGIRGVPAAHGGFETFAANFAPYMVENGYKVTVYCQDDSEIGQTIQNRIHEDYWQGVRRVHIKVKNSGALGTMEFDWLCILHARKESGVALVLGYNTASFLLPLRLSGMKIVTNMDGIEWKRAKWSALGRLWFYLNEWAGAWASNHLIADHPEIANHLSTRRSRKSMTMIPYGADGVREISDAPLAQYGLEKGKYFISIARIEKENSILTLVEAFSQAKRVMKLVVLGKFEAGNAFHQEIKAKASGEVIFPGAIYTPEIVQALRFHARAYCHGHQVGGTNPSLVESLACGNAVLAHDNRFNRWTAGENQFFFHDVESCSSAFSSLIDKQDLTQAQAAAYEQAEKHFTFEKVNGAYKEVIDRYA